MPKWFSYDWEFNGKPANFRVDLDEGQFRNRFFDLLHCSIAPIAANMPFVKAERAAVNKLEKRLLRMLHDSFYAGGITQAHLKQYYFYIPGESYNPGVFEPLTLKERRFCVHICVTNEPDWLTYDRLLYPDTAKYQTELNARLIAQQAHMKDAIEKIRRLSIITCFPTEQDKLFFQEAARQAGFAIGDSSYHAEMPLPHLVVLHTLAALQKPEIDSITTRLIYLAANYHGTLLRWGAPKMSRKSPLA
jgi:hypothetical protein